MSTVFKCADGKGSCCPVTAVGFLKADYATSGELSSFGEGDGKVECYTSGDSSSKNGVLLLPDVWGWNSGKMRAYADMFAGMGYFCLIPKVLDTPNFEGGTDGDGLPPDFDIANRTAELFEWLKSFPITKLEPKMKTILATMDKQEKVATVGFCWGGYFASHIAKAGGDKISCMACPHPSIQVAGLHGEDIGALMSAVKCPTYLLPAGDDDKAIYGEEGSIVKALKAANANSKMKCFEDMHHGWTTRGDCSDEIVKRDTEAAVGIIIALVEENKA